MSQFKITGTVIYVSPVEQFGAGKESKRIIVQSGDKYPNYFPVTFYGDKMAAIGNVNKGDMVEVETFPGGRLKKGDDTQAFCFLNGWNCMVVPTGQTSAPKAVSQQSSLESAAAKFDELPF
jgi:hypothetical protein